MSPLTKDLLEIILFLLWFWFIQCLIRDIHDIYRRVRHKKP